MYYHRSRTEIKSLLPAFSQKVLDVGCGEGETLSWLRSINKCDETFGIEMIEEAGVIAKTIVDHLVIGNIEEYDYSGVKFDLILFLDVLEHLIDPWAVLKKLAAQNLKKGGTVIAIIPNIRYYHVFFPLIFHGQWKYRDTGVLDRTHLRFFTKSSARNLMTDAGLKIMNVLSNPVDVSRKLSLASKLTLHVFRDFLTQQYIIRGTK